MNDNPVPANTDTPPVKKSCCRKKKVAVFILLLLILIAAAASLCCPYYLQTMQALTGTQDLIQIQQRLASLENNMHALDERVNALNVPAVLPAGAEMKEPVATAKPSSQTTNDIARLQNEVATLSATLATLQGEMKESSSHIQHAQQNTQSMLASTLAFVQLRAIAVTSQPFTAELADMRDASANEESLSSILSPLQSVAATGAPTIPELRDEFITLEAMASQAIGQQPAQHWWEKIIIELKNLVSVRHLHGGSDAFTVVESDLAKGDLEATLTDTKNLPPEAQSILNEWRTKVEARKNINEALHSLGEHFSNLTKNHNKQGEP